MPVPAVLKKRRPAKDFLIACSFKPSATLLSGQIDLGTHLDRFVREEIGHASPVRQTKPAARYEAHAGEASQTWSSGVFGEQIEVLPVGGREHFGVGGGRLRVSPMTLRGKAGIGFGLNQRDR